MADPSIPVRRPTLESVTTIAVDGSRIFLHPADVAGTWTLARRISGALLIAVYAALPWIPVNGYPAVFLDLGARRFHFFGLALVAQDLWVLFFAITGLGFLLFFLTAIAGRLWCGWACPYTVFLDHVFRRIERLIEGDAVERRRRDAAPWTVGKIARRTAKHALYFLAAAAIAHVFLSYFISLRGLWSSMRQGPASAPGSFALVAGLTLILWFCFGWFREQFCLILCPYGRLQSVLTDDDTVVVGYDEKRGEPRGPKSKTAGSCIDCRRCVNVCPTGIDIRNGLQMECIGCSACIDACDTVMKKAGLPPGLVRYDSMNGFAGKKRRFLRPRILLYAAMGALGLTALGFTALNQARPYTVELTRMSGPPFYATGNVVRNQFRLRFLNKRNQPARFRIALKNPPPGYVLSGGDSELQAAPLGETTFNVIVLAPASDFHGRCELEISTIAQPGNIELIQRASFLGPDPQTH